MIKKILYLLIFISPSTLISQANFDEAYAPIQKTLTDWDPVRGHWLGNNISNMTEEKIITDRAFPEDFTPYEMLKSLPDNTYDKLRRHLDEGRTNLSGSDLNRWNRLNNYVSNVSCSYIRGRSYGDPHLTSFDDAKTSFQTVGEFSLTRSKSNHLEVQARQKASGSSFSLNSAVAMNVFGDRLCIYSDDKPDSDRSALRLNGEAINLNGRTYYLPHGGNVRLAGRNYIITWPSGETVTVGMRSSFMNISVHVFDCSDQEYQGLLGNADGESFNDFQALNGSMQRPSSFFNSTTNLNNNNSFAEKEYLAYISQSFADDWRVNEQSTLFDYGSGMNTASFTDRTFPRTHHTIHDLSPQQFNDAKTHCQNNGISQSDLTGCIYDQGFLNIPANPAPIPVDFTEDESLNRIRRPALNTNEHEYQEGKYPTGTAAVPIAAPNSSGNNPSYATERTPSKEIESSSTGKENFWGSSPSNSNINKTPNSNGSIFKRPSSKTINNTPSKTFNYSAPSKSSSPSRSTPTRSSSPSISSPSRSKGGKN